MRLCFDSLKFISESQDESRWGNERKRGVKFGIKMLNYFLLSILVDGHATVEEGPFLSERVQGFGACVDTHGSRSEPLPNPSTRRQVRPKIT